MAFVYSTDESYVLFAKSRKRGYRIHNRAKMFATFTRGKMHTGDAKGVCQLSAAVARAANMLQRAVVGYDKENNEIVIVPDLKGNINVIQLYSGHGAYYGGLSLLPFLLYNGFERELIPIGRYEATVDEDGRIHIFLNNCIEERKRRTSEGEAQ